MAGGKIRHWKHGWIPISPEAKAYVAGYGPRPKTTSQITKGIQDDYRKAAEAQRKAKPPIVDKDGTVWSRAAGAVEWREGSYPLDMDKKREITQAIDEFFEEFPGLRQRVPVMAQWPESMAINSALATTDMRKETGHLIELNAILWDDDEVQKMLDDPGSKHISIVGQARTTAEFRNLAIKHEMGHFLQATEREDAGFDANMLSSSTSLFSKSTGNEPHGALDELANEPVTPRSLGYKKGEGLDDEVPRFIADSLKFRSSYAISGIPEEFVAEALLDGLVMGDKASVAGKKALKIARREYGLHKQDLDKLYGRKK